MYIHKHITANNIKIDPYPFLKEIAMEAYLIENVSALSLESVGFDEVTIIDNEITLKDGRDLNKNGRVDIVAKYGRDYIAIIELKIGEINTDTLSQLEGYLRERQQIILKFRDILDSENSGKEPKWIGVMVGETIHPDLMLEIRRGHYLEGTDIPIAAMTLRRFRGKDGNIYVATDTYFMDKVKGKDYTKYFFNGIEYKKNRLVLAVLKDYVQKHPTITYSQLEKDFPPALQGRETFTTEDKAKEKLNEKKGKRNFIEPDELITLQDKTTIAISNQWGIDNIPRFIEHCKKIGITITENK